MTEYINNKIIIIDDEEIIRNTVSEILTGSYTENTDLKDAESQLFGNDPMASQSSSSELFSFTVDCAADGKSGLAMIKKAQKENRPYATAFIDMRMPVWDGLKTAKMIQRVDQRIEIVFLTAYLDYSIEELVKNLGRNIGYHCKPFERSEIRQIATKLCGDWSRLRDLEGLISSISEIQLNAHSLSSIKETVGKILTSWLPTQSLLLAAKSDNSLDCLVAEGNYENQLEDKSILSKLIAESNFTEGMLVDEGGIVTYKSGSCHLIVSGQELSGFKKDKLFLIQIFVENISKTLDNARLNQQIKDKEKLSTIGEALAKVVHDLRMPAGFPQMAIELIRECPEDTDQTHHLMDLMIRSSLDMECYLNDILEFSAKLTLKK